MQPKPAARPGGTPAEAEAGAHPRPEHVPEAFWDAATGQVKVDDLARAHAELGQRFAKGKADFAETVRADVRAELLAEMRQGVPEQPDGYTLAPPREGLPESLVLLDAVPGEDFQPEPDKRYFVLRPDDPLLTWWKTEAHRLGLTQEKFNEGVVQFAAAQARRTPTLAEQQQARQAFYASLGENGVKRAEHLWGTLQSTLGEAGARAIDALLGSKEQFEAIEALVTKAGGPKLAAAPVTPTVAPTLDQLRARMKDPKYWRDRDPAVVREVEQGFARLYPGKVRASY